MPIDTTSQKPPIVVLTGPTATGKTAASIRLAERFPIEVINADSRLFYRRMDIGTAKPSEEERATVPHHLVDILEPEASTSLAEFQDRVYELIRAIHDRRALPVIVGGTLQYINAIVEGWRIPRVQPQPELRARLQHEAEAHGRDRLLARLAELDPAAARTTGPNLRRIIRALEVIEVTGRPISEQQGKSEVWFAPLLIGFTMPREMLYPRIDRRAEDQIAAGLVEEVRALLDSGVPETAPALGSIGYRQLLPYLSGQQTLAEALERIKHDTHRLVRHQQTWLRKVPPLVELDVSTDGWFDRLVTMIESHLERHPLPQ
jgi:tRNA dimethylallyltransferase